VAVEWSRTPFLRDAVIVYMTTRTALRHVSQQSLRLRHRPPLGGGNARGFVDAAKLPKLAVTETALFAATVHDPAPKHGPPLQPTNVEPMAGIAMSLTMVDAG